MASDGFTIGEVLNQLKEDFEDITISKIRFLESEGLVTPDRTESGYRKFSEDDVDRLRFILTAQREHYLPLKVIRDQLQRLDSGDVPLQAAQAGAVAGGTATTAGDGNGAQATLGPGAAGAGASAAMAPRSAPPQEPALDSPPAQVALSVRELCEASGLEAGQVRELRDYGVLSGRGEQIGPFDADDLAAAKAAKDLLGLGLEARHLRMYRQFADRELALFEQLVTPMLRQRNPEARRQATRRLERLSHVTEQLKHALLIRALRGYIHGG